MTQIDKRKPPAAAAHPAAGAAKTSTPPPSVEAAKQQAQKLGKAKGEDRLEHAKGANKFAPQRQRDEDEQRQRLQVQAHAQVPTVRAADLLREAEQGERRKKV